MQDLLLGKDILIVEILFNDQLDAQFFLYMFISIPTCFEHSSAHHQEIHLYQYDICCMSLYVGDRLPSKPAYQAVTYIYQISYWYNEYPDDEYLNSRNMWRIEINIYKKRIAHQVGH